MISRFMKHEKHDFDSAASTWDEKPERVRLSAEIAGAIRAEVPVTDRMDVLDFGCGTGLVTLELQPYARSVTGVDSSHGMLEILNRKIQEKNLSNVRARFLDREMGDHLEGRYHLVVSSMTLHHVEDIPELLSELHEVLLPSGHLCLADLDPDGGRFHDDKAGVVHSGFDRAAMRRLLVDAGFERVRERTAAAVTKVLRDGTTGKFTVFLITGRKA